MTLAARARLTSSMSIELVVATDERAALLRALRSATPPLRSRKTDDGVRVAMQDAGQLSGIPALRLDWDPLARVAVENRQRAASVADDVLAQARVLLDEGVPAARRAIQDWSAPIELDDHQIVNVAVMTLPDGWGACVFDEQGTGKTVTTMAAFDLLVERGESDTLVLVAPKSMVGEWQREFARFLGDVYAVVTLDGDRQERSDRLHSGADVFVMGFETAVAHELEVRLLAERRRAVLVVDESFNVKNPAARRTDALRRIRELCRRCFVLCGTPAPNRPTDVISQFDLVDFGQTFHDLAPAHDRDAERKAVAARLASRGVYTRSVKGVVLPLLPTRAFRDVHLDLEPVQRRAYDAALQDLVIDLEAADDNGYRREILSFLERRLALLQICSNPSTLLQGYEETPGKLLALDVLLDNAASTGEKTVVWSFFRASLDAIRTRYAHHGLVAIDGSTPAAERRVAVRRFQDDDDVRVFVGNPAAAGAGITLHSARRAVYESVGNQAAHWMQSLDRIHRRGQTRDVEYVLLVTRETVEESEFARLRRKAGDQAALLGDPGPAIPTRQELLADLLTRSR